MKRTTKQTISGITLIISIVGIYLFIYQLEIAEGIGYAIGVLIMCALCLISIVALIALSPSGWRLEGSFEEWITAAIINPMILLFYKKEEDNTAEFIKMEYQGLEENCGIKPK